MKRLLVALLLAVPLIALGTDIVRGNLVQLWGATVTLSPAAVSANTSAEQGFTLPGIKTTDIVHAYKPSSQAGLVVCCTRVSAADTVAITFGNLTASTITPTASESWNFVIIRPENTPLPSRFSP